MAVYTDVSAEDLADFLADYDLGELLSYKGIAEGVENSNFLVHTTHGYCFLTLYEKRVAPEDLPFFLGLMEHLSARGLTCPQPVKNRTGDMLGWIAGRPAAIVTVPRRHVGAPSERGALRGGRGGAGEDASCRRGLPVAPAQCAVGRRLAPALCGIGGRRRQRAAGPARDDRTRIDLARRRLALRPAGGRDPCRPVPRQRVLPRRPAIRPD